MLSTKGNTQSANGSNNIQQNGNNNSVSLNVNLPEKLSKSKIFELFQLTFAKLEINEELDNDEIIDLPMAIQSKLEYNKAFRFIPQMEDNFDVVLAIEDVIGDLPKSGHIIRVLKNWYTDKTIYNENGILEIKEGDNIISKLEDQIKNRVKEDKDFATTECNLEDLDIYAKGLVGYGIMECKVLEKPRESKKRD